MNYGISISKGIISNPQITLVYDDAERQVIQCDLNITSGNSGGALLDNKGRLIGITSFRTKDNEGNIVYGRAYSVPINKIRNYLSEN